MAKHMEGTAFDVFKVMGEKKMSEEKTPQVGEVLDTSKRMFENSKKTGDTNVVDRIFDDAKASPQPTPVPGYGYYCGPGYIPRPLIPNPSPMDDHRVCINSIQNNVMGAQQAIIIAECKFDVDMLKEHVHEFFTISITSIHEGRTVSYEAAELIEASEGYLKFDIFSTGNRFPVIPVRSVTGEQYTLSSKDLLNKDLVIQIMPNIILNNRRPMF